MICTRFLENKNFVPQKYWQLKLQAAKENVTFAALSADKYDKQQPAIDTLQRIKEAETVQVKTVERKEVNQEPPLLYDLTTLQKEANTKLNFSADKTLSIAQKLYEGKLISYPEPEAVISHRTCSRKSRNVLSIWNSTPALPDMPPG